MKLKLPKPISLDAIRRERRKEETRPMQLAFHKPNRPPVILAGPAVECAEVVVAYAAFLGQRPMQIVDVDCTDREALIFHEVSAASGTAIDLSGLRKTLAEKKAAQKQAAAPPAPAPEQAEAPHAEA